MVWTTSGASGALAEEALSETPAEIGVPAEEPEELAALEAEADWPLAEELDDALDEDLLDGEEAADELAELEEVAAVDESKLEAESVDAVCTEAELDEDDSPEAFDELEALVDVEPDFEAFELSALVAELDALEVPEAALEAESGALEASEAALEAELAVCEVLEAVEEALVDDGVSEVLPELAVALGEEPLLAVAFAVAAEPAGLAEGVVTAADCEELWPIGTADVAGGMTTSSMAAPTNRAVQAAMVIAENGPR